VDLVPYAIPFFALSILFEMAWDKHKGTGYYRINDAINSLSMGILRTSSALVIFGFGSVLLLQLGQQYRLFDISTDSALAWVLAFIGYDFLYYWFHRISHERQVLWASHVAHHQSEEYNLTTALRQTSTGFLLGWIFYVPSFLLGVPPEMFITVASVNLLYQYWVHTRFVPKLGWFEWFFVSPSNHRVHHARNPRYLDRNYGGVFIVWDRLFGSFQEELEEEAVEFGISKPLQSWNPLWANLHVYRDMLKNSWNTPRWRDKLYLWVAPPAWQVPGQTAPSQPGPLPKYDPDCTPAARIYALLLMLAMFAWGSYYLVSFAGQDYPARLAGFALILASLMEAGAVLENNTKLAYGLVRRATLCASLVWLGYHAEPLLAALYYGLAILAPLLGWLVSGAAGNPAAGLKPASSDS
jgi:alkylglycerol monooxygenase